MVRSAIPADTDPTAFAVLAERWRAMSIRERADLTEQICVDVERDDRGHHGPVIRRVADGE